MLRFLFLKGCVASRSACFSVETLGSISRSFTSLRATCKYARVVASSH